ncbi:two-component system sensor histidine kinase CreC [Massilia sp. TSP1-1-2]|uniref:two-component system sensor histidine kinase CreC n=1 Tax=unclassified Massilia TaxID=2609279 RepID=UPI003CF32C1C
MKIGLRILLGYFLIVGLAAWFVLAVFMQQVKPGVRATQEDALVDTAQLLAALVADDVKRGNMAASPLLEHIRAARQHSVNVTIAGIPKQHFNYRIYITDANGIVTFDSLGADVGKNYAKWNDVLRTLRGQYGARSTRAIYDDDSSTVMHVAAPILDGPRIIGVLTVAKPNSAVQPFVERSQQVILQRGALLLALSLLIGGAFAWWLSNALRKLMVYIADVEAGKKAPLPALGNNEIGTLGRALESMREKLEGKEYVEELMHTMAHELKSPIAAIQGSAELLQEDMASEQRQHFLANILNQNARQKQLIDKLLELIRVEKQQHLAATTRIGLGALALQVRDDCAARMQARGQQLVLDAADIQVDGDALLLRQALGNLLDNAIDFSPEGGVIALRVEQRGDQAVISVSDQGTGIPEYARERLFERFYSLPRPGGAKSTGLGLPFVHEVIALHGGRITVANGAAQGTLATVELPVVQ